MQFMDSHIHLQDFKRKDTPNIIAESIKLGIDKLICVSAIETDWNFVADLYEQFSKNIIPAFGLHPWYLQDARDGWEQRLEQILQKYPQALIGEIGLDKTKDSPPELQNSIFAQQLDLAKEYNRPLILHAVQASGWLDNYWHQMPKRFVFHSFNSNLGLLRKAIAAGGYVSFSSSILRHPKKTELVSAVPYNRLLLETDAPFQSMNLADLPQIATEIATLRGENLNEMATRIYQNSLEFINVK